MAALNTCFFSTFPPVPPKLLVKPISLQSSSHRFLPPACNLSLRSSSSSLKTHLSSLLKPTLVTLTTAAALLLYRHPSPSLAAAISSPIPPQQSESQSLRSLMELNIKSHNYPKAIEIIDSIISLENPDTPELLLLKSHLQIQSGDSVSAAHSFEHLISQDPFLVEAYHGLVMDRREAGEEVESLLERIEDAMAVCKKEKRDDDLRDFKLLKAEIKVVQEKYEEAIKVYEEVVKEDPRDFRPYLCQGIVYTMMGRRKEAEKAFDKYRKVKPTGHQYACYFDDNVAAANFFGQLGEEKTRKEAGMKSVF